MQEPNLDPRHDGNHYSFFEKKYNVVTLKAVPYGFPERSSF